MRTTAALRKKLEKAAAASGRSLVQEVEYRLEQSFQAEGATELLTDMTHRKAIDDHIESTFWSSLGALGEPRLFSPEFQRKLDEGGHPPMPPEIRRALRQASKKAGLSPEEYWKGRLREIGVDPEAPYVAPPDEQNEK